MTEFHREDKNQFIYPRSAYYGQFKPENILFNAKLQEFAQKVTYISSLETSGKITPQQAYQKIETLWQNLKGSKKQLNTGKQPEPPTTP
ncbi:DUF7219 family protein [Umezakia ovalisporum]|jgi:isopropylmalate/homocitrate/citramalate synthase|uniref:Isopropylmalate/homocitrate/citramalate synthases n=2 Tax=Umezakia ovalisporum TaxID=75695 RepID=A0AA43H0F2_9CYAN|nr:hypothetical protein [Umezakia ovalisporum]MBI1240774.1 hypothetical protein [Nostoc sp. RI_552]MDH6058008.1 hypothetical protein [Umezakia ovalisporum FSS-43]MDH6065179.1 hypothetical protein [Umezakia ovalisporum FSS-62]MDH6066928.1 hypothetical protein [Umezakia ovalisporum APH033B]MDH6072031.1 hypothetical protein [Umezakia ovalisporum CobakiLakeA]